MVAQSADSWTPKQLAQLLDIDALVFWGDQDAAAALRHQLGAPLFPDLAGYCSAGVQARWNGSGQTFREQLTTGEADIEILRGIKSFARQMRDEVASPLQGRAATMLYYAAIARARVVDNARIAELDDDHVKSGCRWALKQTGVEELRDVFHSAIQKLG